MKDYYGILGVSKGASESEIKRAYRRLASQHHPDKGGTTERFQQVQEAYAVLSDPEQRQKYDNPHVAAGFSSDQSNFDFDGIFRMFGTRFGDSRMASTARIQLWIGLVDVILGGPRNISVSSPAGQHTIEITIPTGIEDGASVRYPRLAPGGVDLVATFRVRPEPGWHRQDRHLIHDVNASIWDLLLGAETVITTLSGRQLTVTIPAGTQPGSLLRLRGHGIPSSNTGIMGDLLIKISAKLPENVSPELQQLIRRERGQ